MSQAWLAVDAPAGIAVSVTQRHFPGAHSVGEFGTFNLADHVGDSPGAVQANRRLLAQSLAAGDGISPTAASAPYALQWLNQVHGNACVAVSAVTPPPAADAAWTDRKGIGLALLTADCVPLVLADVRGGRVAVCHAGWRGLQQNIIAATYAALQLPAQRVWAWVGPCISAAHYEVGQDVWGQFDGPGVINHSDTSKRYLDLPAIAAGQLSALGVQQVQQSGLCTYGDGRFFSHRRSQQQLPKGHTCGRFATIARLV